MMKVAARRSTSSRSTQRGQALLISLLLIVSVGTTLFVYGASSEVNRVIQAEVRTRAVLEQARDALVARAVSDANKPGSLPCPDAVTTNPAFNNYPDDGSADQFAGTECPSYIGRLPWRTLGIGDLRDANGERLWYALSPNFRDSSVQINSDTKGNRTVYSGSPATTLTNQAVAIIFAPGPALAGQLRDKVSAPCNMSGVATTLQHKDCAANYLESASGTWNNASATGPYISARETPVFNDKTLVLRAADFIPIVERRVARELREVLRDYRLKSRAAASAGGCDCFPWPDGDSDGNSNTGVNRGRIPTGSTLPHAWGTTWIDPITSKPYIDPTTKQPFDPLPSLPAYFQQNAWQNVIYYTVAKTSLENAGAACTTCSANATLSVDGGRGYGAILMTPGIVRANQIRSKWSHYIAESENRDADPQAAGSGAAADPAPNDIYVTPPRACPAGQCPAMVQDPAFAAIDPPSGPSHMIQRCVASNLPCPNNVTAPTRGRLYSITASPPNAQCAPNALSLIRNAPCHTTGNKVKAVCQQAYDNLVSCSCEPAAKEMIQPPCRNSLNPPACQADLNILKTCTP